MNRGLKLCSTLAAAACALLAVANAEASPINNPCPSGGGTVCQFRFDINSAIPFLDFSSGEDATDLSTLSYFGAYVDSSGTMTFHDSDMQLVDTSFSLGGNPIQVRLTFSSVTGTTDLSGTPDITWRMMTTASFKHSTYGITEANCVTSSFPIYFSGVDWGNGTSDKFTIPSVSGCNGYDAVINFVLGLGTDGATLTLYKFRGVNGSTVLTGS